MASRVRGRLARLTAFSASGTIPDDFYQVLNMSAQERIKQQVTGNPVVLYMKGTPQFPQCGFSANAVQILKACGVEQIFTVNVLEEPEIRQGIKEYANWPTIPQLYVNGEFVGGSDIMREMYQSGELQKLLTGEKTPS
jgi:monothiol glutaredoxin